MELRVNNPDRAKQNPFATNATSANSLCLNLIGIILNNYRLGVKE
jgi:hypothetical protein